MEKKQKQSQETTEKEKDILSSMNRIISASKFEKKVDRGRTETYYKFNDAFVLVPKKSVVFRTQLFEKQQEKHSKCSSCSAEKCVYRTSEYAGATRVLKDNADAKKDLAYISRKNRNNLLVIIRLFTPPFMCLYA